MTATNEAVPAEPLACPFCGSSTKPEVAPFDGEPRVPGFMVRCNASGWEGNPNTGCGSTSGWAETEAEAIAAWNTRAIAQAAGVVVKPLAWEDVIAPTPFGAYTVSEGTDDLWHFTYHEYPYGSEDDEGFASEAEAKAAAFADYKRRILAALSPQATSVPGADEQPDTVQAEDADDLPRIYGPWNLDRADSCIIERPDGTWIRFSSVEETQAFLALLAAAPPPPAQPVTDKEAEKRNIGVGMAIAAGIVMVTAGDEVRAREILGAAGYDTEQSLRDDGVDDYDINLLRPLFADDDAGAQP